MPCHRVNPNVSSDPDINLVLEFVIGDYLSIIEESDPEHYRSFLLGVRKIATLTGIRVVDYDCEGHFQKKEEEREG